MKILRVIKRFTSNLLYLASHDLREENSLSCVVYRTIRQNEELVRAHLVYSKDESFHIADDEETWFRILSSPKSFLRIGDGELALIEGRSIDFQKYDKRLAEMLMSILQGTRTDIYVGIDYNYFNGFDNVTDRIRKHNYLNAPVYKKTLVKYCNPDREYISSSFNQLYIDYENYDWDKYLGNIRALFDSRDIVVFAGKGIFDGLKFNVFDAARSCEYVWASPKNAFDGFDYLLAKARTFSKDKVLCFILGPASKPLVHELSKEGYLAWDLGHMAKDYDWCCRKMPKSSSYIVDFFAPD